MSNLNHLPNRDAVASAAAALWKTAATQAVAERGRFAVALSDGSTLAPLYQKLSEPPYSEDLPWEQTYIFWTDEKRVASSDPESNYHAAYDLLLSRVPVPPDHIFPMSGQELASSAVRAYDDVMWRYFNLGRGEWPRFDLVYLGVGLDGHTASIFPGTRAASDLSNRAIVYLVPSLNAERITLTLPVLNNARQIVFMVSGAEKAEILKTVLQGPYLPSTYPAQLIAPRDGILTWLVDEDAASGLA